MARPLRVEFPGALYFVTARAVPRQKLFRNPDEVQDFVRRLPELADSFQVVFHGYCLLPNHYHLIIETPEGNLSRALHRLNSGYTSTVNARRRRSGPLLQSRYHSLLLDEDPWLLRLSVHLHQNPVRMKLSADPWSYSASSAWGFREGAEQLPWLSTARVVALAGGREAYAALLESKLSKPPPFPWKEVWRQCVLGGPALRNRVLGALEGVDTREIAGFTGAREGVGIDDIVGLVAENTGVEPGEIRRSKFQRVLARKLAIHLARRFTGLTLRQIGEAFGVDYTTVHMVSRRVEGLAREDEGVAELLRTLESELGVRAAGAPSVVEPEETTPSSGEPDERKPAKEVREKKPRRDASQLTLF